MPASSPPGPQPVSQTAGRRAYCNGNLTISAGPAGSPVSRGIITGPRGAIHKVGWHRHSSRPLTRPHPLTHRRLQPRAATQDKVRTDQRRTTECNYRAGQCGTVSTTATINHQHADTDRQTDTHTHTHTQRETPTARKQESQCPGWPTKQGRSPAGRGIHPRDCLHMSPKRAPGGPLWEDSSDAYMTASYSWCCTGWRCRRQERLQFNSISSRVSGAAAAPCY